MKCRHYKYFPAPSPIGWVGGCSLGLFGLYIITCNSEGKCASYEEVV
jgi:hypothetical protein